ncbi:competence protein CoiA [Burkholderia sp. SIMBA_062]|uniref:competence protein CoiA n=1 Tax=Burkholderia sp. SIMBA_062 TaxID=3085803 RepID=UPI00397AA10A
MPLKCLSSDGPVHAFDYSREQFELLRLKHNSQRHLSFKCCAGQVGLRVSSTGFQHFYHVKRGGCRYDGESLEHLQAKATIAQAARQAGWSVEIEAEDEQGRWQADVLLSRGSVRLAFEVQWSAQTWAETLVRQQRYADSKVRGLWLFRRPTYEPSEKTPAFQLRKADTPSGFEVLVSPPNEKWVLSRDPDDWRDLAAFVSSALQRRLRFGMGAGARRFSLQYAVHEAEKPCGCGAEVVVPYSLVATPLDLAGHRPYRWHKDQPWRYPHAWRQAFRTATRAPEGSKSLTPLGWTRTPSVDSSGAAGNAARRCGWMVQPTVRSMSRIRWSARCRRRSRGPQRPSSRIAGG